MRRIQGELFFKALFVFHYLQKKKNRYTNEITAAIVTNIIVVKSPASGGADDLTVRSMEGAPPHITGQNYCTLCLFHQRPPRLHPFPSYTD